MNRKIRILVLFLMLALFTGSQVYAQDQDGSLPAPKEEKILAESSFQEESPKAQARKEDQKTERGQVREEANLPQDQAKEEEPVTQTGKETGQEDPQKENPDQKSPAQEPQVLESAAPTSPDQAKSPAPTEPTPGKDETKPSGEPKEGQEGTGKKPEDKKDKPQVDPKGDKDLSDLQGKIQAEKDKKKKAALQKEYNEKLFKKIEEAGADKLDKEVLKRFTNKKKTEEFYELQAEYEELKKKAKEGKLTQEEVNAFNKKVGNFKPPRKLEDDEKEAQKKLADSVDVPGLKEGASKDPKAKEKLDAYNKAKEALKNALDSEKARNTSKEELKKLLDEFEAAEKALKDGINDGTISPTYTDGTPTVRVFPLTNGSVGDELTNDPKKGDNPYYIPDNTSIELLVHVNKDEDPKDFTFTIRAIDQGAVVEGEKASNLAFLNGTPVDLVRNEDGSYTFKVSSENMNFGIAQLRFNIPGFEGPFHKGFDLEMDLGDGNKVTKQFRITKKGYEDEAHLNGPGSDSADDPTKIPEVDAGDTENAKVKEDSAKEVLDFFTYLKKSNTYIDEVTFNSGNGQSLPLDSVDITITVPKSGENNFAKMIHKSGLEYHDLGDGRYQLKLDRKVFGGNLVKKGDKLYLTDKNGNKTEQELTAANLKDVILENAGKKVYVDNEKNAHEIITSEVLADKNGSYKVENGKLYKKNDENQNKFDEIGTFDKDGKIEKDGKTYILKDGKLISYTKEHDVYDGNVVNKKDDDGNYKADPNVTPTYEGNQVTIKTEVTKDGNTTTETSYGGTIVKDAIYDKNGKIFKETGYTGKSGTVLIGPDGKAVNGITYDSKDVKEDKKTGVKIVTVKGVSYHIVENPVFKNDYIIDGLEYKEGLSLIDKFGKKMNVKVTEEEGTYTFTKILKDKEGNEIEDEDKVKSGKKDNRNVIVGTDDTKPILVNSKNEVVKDPENKYTKIGPKYYYNGKEFVKADGDGLQGDKFFEDFKEFILKKTTTYSYMDGKEQKEIKNFADKKVYEGSLNPKDYFKADSKIYVKKSQGAGSTAAEYYVSADPKASNEILSVNKIAKIVQTLGEGKNAIKKVTEETDIFDAVQNAKFALRFPGFLAGKNIVYNVHADVKATYKKPKAGQEGEFENVNVFTKDGIKKIDKFFTLKNEKETNTSFFKHAPKELKADPAVNLHFFNIFYRNADDRKRDQLILDLLAKEDDLKKEEAKVNAAQGDEAKKKAQEAVDEFKKKNKEELALIAKFKEELNRLYDGATFGVKVNNGEKTLVIKDKDDNVIEADELNKMRSLLWEVGFENKEGTLFPENPDTEIIIEDHNMDNRLIYDEIIVNDTRENWDKLNKAHEDAKKKVAEAEKALKENKDESKKAGLEANLETAKKALENAKFKGTKDYFFLDQIKDIRFGVNPNYINGRFVPLGENFKITGQEIIKKLKDNPSKKSVVIEKSDGDNKIEFLVTRDSANGQVRIKVMNAFYAKAKEDSDNKFYSPAQEAYQKKIDDLWTSVEGLELNSNEEAIKGIVEKLHADGSDCFDVIKEKLTKELDEIKNDTELNNIQKKEKFNKFKKNLKKEIKKLQLTYLDSKKGDYKYDDMRFNAIRIGLNPGITIGGAMNPENTKKIGISSVIIPKIDIPYTDEFGELLTNKDKYVYEAIEKIKADKKSGENIEGLGGVEIFDKEGKEIWKSNEDSFRKVMEEAYKIVNDNKGIKIEELVTIKKDNEKKVGMEKYTAKKGSDLSYTDLAVNGESLKNKNSFAINPWYIVKGDKTKSVEEIFQEKFGAGYKDMPEYKKLEDMPIDIAAYYMSKQGYDRSKYANQANYKLSGGDKKDGLFGSDSDWHKKICYPGLGHCIEQAGKNSKPGENPDQGKFGAEEEKGADFELTYEPTNKGPEKEEPKVDKKSGDNDKSVDITGEEDKKVDFTIEVTVDKMTKEQKDIADALTPEKPKKPADQMTDEEKKAAEEEKKAAEADKKAKEIEAGNYKDNGYYEYKNSLIIDFLPEIFKLKQGETILTFTPDKGELMANGANAGFKDEETFKKWEAGIEYFYTDDLLAEYEKLSKSSKEEDKEKAEVLKKAIEDAKADGKIKDGQKVQAVLAWLPNFEAPHGSEKQFTFKLSNVFVDKKKFKDFEDGIIGTNYTNHAAFGDKARFYFGKTTVNIHENPKGKVNKYLQLLDKDGNVIDKDKAEGWFKGNAELKFGDKFNYRIEYHNNTGVVAVPGEANDKSTITLDDLFAKVSDKGLRPVLNGFITSDFEFEHQVKVIYKVGEKSYTEAELRDAIKANTVKFSDVTSVVLEGKYENGATHNFYLPMMVPNLDAKIENGKVVYIGTDGEKHELGKAEDFFNLKDLKDKDKELAFDNSIEGSNTVTVYLEKNRFIRLFKEFFDANGEEIKKDRPEMKFDIYQYQTDKNGNPIKDEKGNIIKVKVLDKDGKPLQLVVNEKNNFTDMKSNLPLFKKTISFGKDGKAIETVTNYKYELVENDASGYDVKFEVLDNGEDQLGFVIKAKNTEKPERPPHNPPEEPKTPPEEPGKPPETPGEKPKYPQDIPGDTPGKPRKPRTPNNLPKTGLVEDLGLVYLSGLALAGLVLLRKKYFLD
ncbi:hypothetical protein HMPREF1633_05125 [Tissierellia bacterium S5-A11]|nr:hypothetical protein HMPREF1633_05125 [Tissierellia bacterium S5-A11]